MKRKKIRKVPELSKEIKELFGFIETYNFDVCKFKNVKSNHITPVGGNIFSDLGFKDSEAIELKFKSDKIISEKLKIKD